MMINNIKITTIIDEMDSKKPLVTDDINELTTPGVMVELSADEAESLGAFIETALTNDEAWESNCDLQQGEKDGR
jgi:type IV secretion system protein VirB1